MALTDLELKAISQIAYYDLEKFKTDKDGKISVWEALTDEQRKTMAGYGITEFKLREWKVVGVYNDNASTGFCACIIETKPGEAAVGFRGSEDLDELNDVAQDWVGADLGLLNSTLTAQQAEAHEFLKKYTSPPNAVLNNYDELVMTGHSLGGNLAEYSTIFSDMYGLDDNIVQCASLDGPGYSEEFISLNRKRIEKMSDVMYHPRWSWVGGLLQDLPGVNYKYIDVENSKREKNEYNFATRHSLGYVKQDETDPNNFASGQQDEFAKFTETLTEGVDHLPAPIGNALVTLVGGVWIGLTWAKEVMFDDKGNLTASGWAIVAGAIGLIATTNLGTLVTVVVSVLTVLVAILAVLVVAYVFELAYDLFMNAVDAICNAVKEIAQWAKETYQQFRDAVTALVNKLKNWWNMTFNPGYRQANTNPQIRADTNLLIDYAGRLYKVNKRLIDLDKRIDDLYWKVGLQDLWDLTCGDLGIGWSNRVNKCANYLNDTANKLNSTENALINSL